LIDEIEHLHHERSGAPVNYSVARTGRELIRIEIFGDLTRPHV